MQRGQQLLRRGWQPHACGCLGRCALPGCTVVKQHEQSMVQEQRRAEQRCAGCMGAGVPRPAAPPAACRQSSATRRRRVISTPRLCTTPWTATCGLCTATVMAATAGCSCSTRPAIRSATASISCAGGPSTISRIDLAAQGTEIEGCWHALAAGLVGGINATHARGRMVQGCGLHIANIGAGRAGGRGSLVHVGVVDGLLHIIAVPRVRQVSRQRGIHNELLAQCVLLKGLTRAAAVGRAGLQLHGRLQGRQRSTAAIAAAGLPRRPMLRPLTSGNTPW